MSTIKANTISPQSGGTVTVDGILDADSLHSSIIPDARLLQVVNNFETSSYKWTNVLGNYGARYNVYPLDTTITTTKANSKILYLATITLECEHDAVSHLGRTAGGAGEVLLGRTGNMGMGLWMADVYNHDFSTTPSTYARHVIDTPNAAASTALTYKFYVNISWNGVHHLTLNRSWADTSTNNTTREEACSSITLIEFDA